MSNPTYKILSETQGTTTWEEWANTFSNWDEVVGAWTWDDLQFNSFNEVDVLQVSVNRQLADIFNRLSAAQADIILDNEEEYVDSSIWTDWGNVVWGDTYVNGRFGTGGVWSPEKNTKIRPESFISIKAKKDSTWYGIFGGFIKDISINAKLSQRELHITARDRASLLRRNITVPLRQDIKTNSLATEVLSRANIGPFAVDTISDEIPFSLFDDIRAGEAINRLKESGLHYVFVDGQGELKFKNRSARKKGTAVASLTEFLDFEYTLNEENLVNQSRVSGTPREPPSNVTTVAELNTSEPINPNGKIDFWVRYQDPETEEPTPVNSIVTEKVLGAFDFVLPSSTDWKLNTNSDGTGTDKTDAGSISHTFFGRTAKITMRNTDSSTVYLHKFFMRGFPLRPVPGVAAETIVDSSQNKFEEQIFNIENDLIPNKSHADLISRTITNSFHDPLPQVTATIKNDFDNQLGSELLDTIALRENLTRVDTTYIIKEIEHNIDFVKGLEHTTTYRVE